MYESKLPDDRVNIPKKSPLGDLFGMLTALVAIVVILYYLFGFAIDYAVKKISAEDEQRLLSFLKTDIKSTHQNSDTARRIQKLLDSAAASSCFQSPYRFVISVSDSNISNAFAVPGGVIVINRGLIEKAESENEILFVVGHEIAHFQNRDHLEGLGRRFVATALAHMAGFSDSEEIVKLVVNLSENRFSQAQESEADLYAVDLMNCYYGHVSGATDFFRHLPKQSNYALLSTHPATRERIENIEAYIARKGYAAREKDPF